MSKKYHLREPFEKQHGKRVRALYKSVLQDLDHILWSLAWKFSTFCKKMMTLTAFVFPKLRSVKTWLSKRLKSPVSEDAWTSNMVNVPSHC